VVEAPQEGAECDAETEGAAKASEAAAAEQQKQQKLGHDGGKSEQAGAAVGVEDWQMGNASDEAAAMAAGGAAEDGPGPAAVAEAGRPVIPSNWLAMTKPQ